MLVCFFGVFLAQFDTIPPMPKKKKKGKVISAKQNKSADPSIRKVAPRLIFMNGGQWQGFTNSAVSQFNDVNPSSTIREFIQNSLDAAVQAGKETAEIHFIVQDTNRSEIPGMEEYKNALNSSIQEHKKEGLYNNQSEQVAERLFEASNKLSFPTLFVIDNGVGFDKKLLAAMCGDGSSQKGSNDSNAAGSYGNGHLTAFSLSELQYIFYGGVRQDDTIFGGHAIIASHKQGKKSYGKDGYYACKLNTEELYDKFSFPTNKEDMPDFVKPHINFIREQGESGAIVAVPAFNNFGKNANEVSDLIIHNAAVNFFVAIHRGTLRINVNIDNQNTLLDKDNLGDILEICKNQRRSSQTGFPSGANAWSSYQTLIKSQKYNVETGHGKIQMCIKKDEGEKNIVLCRNGMWISKNIHKLGRATFANKKPFDLVILAEDSQTSVYKIFKAAEGPLHNEIKRNRLGSADDRKKFDECLDNIIKYINKLIDDSPTEEFSPTDFMSIARGEAVNQGKNQANGPTAERISASSRIHGNRGGNKKKKKPNSRPSSQGNIIPVRMASRHTRPGVLAVSFTPSDKNDSEYNAELHISVDKGADATCTSSLEKYDWDKIRFNSVKINNEKISENNFIKDGDKVIGINIGVIKAAQKYQMEIEYDDTHLPISGNYTISYAFISRKKNSQNEG